MAKKKMLDEVVVEEVEGTETIEITIEEPKEECKKDGLATVMVMVNSIRYEGVIVRRGDHLKMCKDEAQKAVQAKRCIIL